RKWGAEIGWGSIDSGLSIDPQARFSTRRSSTSAWGSPLFRSPVGAPEGGRGRFRQGQDGESGRRVPHELPDVVLRVTPPVEVVPGPGPSLLIADQPADALAEPRVVRRNPRTFQSQDDQPRGVAVAGRPLRVSAARLPASFARRALPQLRQAPAPVSLLGAQELLDELLPVRFGKTAGQPGRRPEAHRTVVQQLLAGLRPEVLLQGGDLWLQVGLFVVVLAGRPHRDRGQGGAVIGPVVLPRVQPEVEP